MQKPISFKKIILKQTVSAQIILQALAPLSHVIFLEDQNQPVICFLANQYQQLKNDELKAYVRTNLDQYEESDTQPLQNIAFQDLCSNLGSGFSGGWAGFISYDYAAQQQISLHAKAQPRLFLGQFSSFLKLENDGWYFYSSDHSAAKIYDYIDHIIQTEITQNQFKLRQKCTARWSKSDYTKAFDQVQEYIKAGDCYQINLTQEFTAQANGSLLDTAQEFWSLTDAPYSGYLRINDFEILSCSPELFIDFKPKRKIITKPIKGTMPRYEDPILDEQSKQRLKSSEKDMAENVMIVDLLRNDLSIYAETGSVKTPKLFDIESFNQVHHMVSEVEAVLKTDVNPFEVLMSALPGGSITGAPKIRAMQIIEELEGAPRGAYCGSMGYFNHGGTGSWNILIRSIQKYQDQVSLWAGGGITIASDCDAEYQECFDKVEAMLDLLNTWYKPD
ncbi:anthranilate synthase component I family protein [Acinetobacter sp. YH12129]|uniref:anthranilate synthase component I family protein n=1 Tax=Acinetobacter sp. YH12129 TaxID=2601114 RepID=UPI0015D1E6B9|nr:anthranilate synthase component I family protein [Acinetobacter sp. YH12129]